MRSKTTTYNNINFRSVLEARWAFFLDLLGVPWQYEKEKVDLGGGLRYVPDFWLNDHQVWLEIKGTIANDKAGVDMIEKAGKLAVQTGFPTLLTFYSPLEMRCALFSKHGKMYTGARFTACPSCGRFAIAVRTGEKVHRLCAYEPLHIPFDDTARQSSRTIYNAAQAATRLK